MFSIKIDLRLTIIALVIVVGIIITDAVLVGMVMDSSGLFAVNAVLFTVGLTLIGVLVLLYLLVKRNDQHFYIHRILGYGEDGSVPRIRREFTLVKEDEFA